MTIPGFSVKFVEKKWIRSAHDQIMSDVELFWRNSPLIRIEIWRACGFVISSAVTTTGPSGALVSKAFPRPSSYQTVPLAVVRTCRSRAVTSLTIV